MLGRLGLVRPGWMILYMSCQNVAACGRSADGRGHCTHAWLTYLRAYCLSHLGHLKGFSPVSAMSVMGQDLNPERGLRDRW